MNYEDDGESHSYRDIITQTNWIYCFLYLIPLGTICGNVFVCLAVFIERRLRNGFNLFLVSLAVSDMLCAILVMPFSATKIVFGIETSREVCLVWYSLDVFFTSTTIIHLCTISLDRYLVLRKPLQYGPKRDVVDYTFCGKISIAWLISFFIAGPLFLIAMFLDKSDQREYADTMIKNNNDNNNTQTSYKGCGPNDPAYVLTAVAITFILPLIIMTMTYLLTINTLRRKMNQAKSAQLYRNGTSNLSSTTKGIQSLEQQRSFPNNQSSHKSSISDGIQNNKDNSDNSSGIVIFNRLASIDNAMLDGDIYDQDAIDEKILLDKKSPPKIVFTPSPPPSAIEESMGTMNKSCERKMKFHNVVNKVKQINRQEKLANIGQSGGIRRFEIWRIVRDYKEFLEREDQKLESEWAMSSMEDEEDLNNSSPILNFRMIKKFSNEKDSDNSALTSLPHDASSKGRDKTPKRIPKNSLATIFSTGKLSGESFRIRMRYFRSLSSKDQSAEKRNMDRIHKGHRAMQVIGVLFAVFFTCYTPFFVIYLTGLFCKSCEWTTEWIGIIEWLGYLGSMLNPFVYHFFNPAFRRTFRRMFKFDYTRSSRKGDSSSKSIKTTKLPK